MTLVLQDTDSLSDNGYLDGFDPKEAQKKQLFRDMRRFGGVSDMRPHDRGEFTGNGFQNDLAHDRGVLSMARAMNPNSAGSQFFSMVEKAPHLDGQYAAFGKVIEGMEVADAIVSAKTDWNDRPREDQRMKKVTVETFGVEYPEPEKV